MKFCQNCGFPLNESISQCPNCGFIIENTTEYFDLESLRDVPQKKYDSENSDYSVPTTTPNDLSTMAAPSSWNSDEADSVIYGETLDYGKLSNDKPTETEVPQQSSNIVTDSPQDTNYPFSISYAQETDSPWSNVPNSSGPEVTFPDIEPDYNDAVQPTKKWNRIVIALILASVVLLVIIFLLVLVAHYKFDYNGFLKEYFDFSDIFDSLENMLHILY